MRQPPSPYPFLNSQSGIPGMVTLLGVPLDRTGSFRPGCGGGPVGIRWASENLETYSPQFDLDLEDMLVGDLGDMDFSGLTLEEAVLQIEEEVGQLLDAPTIPFLLGGEHTIALPIARAVLKRYPTALVLHIDAHADLRESYLEEKLSHAAWAYHVGNEFGFQHLVQLGIRSGLRQEFQLGRSGGQYFSATLEIPDKLFNKLSTRPIYLSLDIDVLDPSIVPGTGTPEAGGVTYAELMHFFSSLPAMHIVAMDINEVAPSLDPTGVTSAVAAKVVREMLLLFTRNTCIS